MRSSRWDSLYDLITFLMVLSSVALLGGSLLIAANPSVPFNPLPPPTLPAVLQLPSATPTASPTLTATASPTPSQTLTPTASLTFTPSFTPSASLTPSQTVTPSLTPSQTPTATPVLAGLPSQTPSVTPTVGGVLPISTEGIAAQPGIIIPTGPAPAVNAGQSAYPFVASSPTRRANSNSQGCDWLGIAGQVIGITGEPLINYPVEIAGDQFLEVQFSGSAPSYGASGFEINVGNRPRQATFSIRLLGPTGDPLSEYILLETGGDCDSNLTVIELRQVRPN